MAFPPPRIKWFPRCWIDGYDHWHLPVFGTWVCLLLFLALGPTGPTRPSASAPVVRALPPTTILAPTNGMVFRGIQPGLVTGISAPGVIVKLFAGQQFVGQNLSGLDGHFQFRLPPLPQGTNTLHVAAVAMGQVSWSAPVVIIISPAQPKRPVSKQKLKPVLKSPV